MQMMVGGTQMLLCVSTGESCVSTGDRDAVLRQIWWCVAIQTPVNGHCKLEENPVGSVKPMQLVVQYLTQAAIKLPSDNMRSSICNYDKLVTTSKRYSQFGNMNEPAAECTVIHKYR